MQPTTATSTSTRQRWTVLSLIDWSTNHLLQHGFDEARLHVELLLAHVLEFTRLQLYTNFDRPLSTSELSLFKKLFTRRMAHEPLQYILGETEFMGLPLYVNSNVLIPRPETEELVEKTIKTICSLNKQHMDILDIGTGSGNIPIAISKFVPNVSITSIDPSENAQEVAKANIERHSISNVSLVCASVFDDFLPGRMFDVIVSNPPYISLQEFDSLQPEVKEYEPRLATTDNGDGFRFLRRISGIAAEKLASGGYLIMEIAYNQSEFARKIAGDAGLVEVEVFPDLSGHPRILSARTS